MLPGPVVPTRAVAHLGVVAVPRRPDGIQSCLVAISRQCSKTACGNSAFATLTYVYAEQTAVLGPLATYAEPHSYDLCDEHARRMTAPRGWDIVRLQMEEAPPDDLVALAEAVREHKSHVDGREARPARSAESSVTEVGRRGHLRLLRDR